MVNAKTFLEKRSVSLAESLTKQGKLELDRQQLQRRYKLGRRHPHRSIDTEGRIRGTDDGKDDRNRSCYCTDGGRLGWMEYKLSEFETEADVPKVDGRGSQGLSRALAECNVRDPRPDLNRRCVNQWNFLKAEGSE